MDFELGGPLLELLLLVGGGASTRMGTRKELLVLPNGRTSLEHALETLHSAVPSARIIYISIHDESQVTAMKPALERIEALEMKPTDHDHQILFPSLEFIFDLESDIGPAAGLLAAHRTQPNTKWLVLGCDYPLLPPYALQQLILEYRDPVTRFRNAAGFAEPLIAIWSPESLEKLRLGVGSGVENGIYGFNRVVNDMNGNLVRPLREHWITRTSAKEEWEMTMKMTAR